MTDLGPNARALLDAGADDAPTAADRQRVWSSIEKRITPIAATAATAAAVTVATSTMTKATATMTTTAAAALSSVATKVVLASVLVVAAAGGLALSSSRSAIVAPKVAPGVPSPAAQMASLTPPQTTAEPSTAALVASANTTAPPPPATTTSPSARPHATKTTASAASSAEPTMSDSLEDEIALIAEANRALSKGDVARALTLLDRHAETFPDGALAHERRAARVIAACKLGRADAQAEAAKFLAAHSSSPHASRIRAACGEATP